jgi:hypothetical protein
MPRGDRSSYGGFKGACQAMVASGVHRCYLQGYMEREGYKFCVQHARVYDMGRPVQLATEEAE